MKKLSGVIVLTISLSGAFASARKAERIESNTRTKTRTQERVRTQDATRVQVRGQEGDAQTVQVKRNNKTESRAEQAQARLEAEGGVGAQCQIDKLAGISVKSAMESGVLKAVGCSTPDYSGLSREELNQKIDEQNKVDAINANVGNEVEAARKELNISLKNATVAQKVELAAVALVALKKNKKDISSYEEAAQLAQTTCEGGCLRLSTSFCNAEILSNPQVMARAAQMLSIR
jgi:hypothetical protein